MLSPPRHSGSPLPSAADESQDPGGRKAKSAYIGINRFRYICSAVALSRNEG